MKCSLYQYRQAGCSDTLEMYQWATKVGTGCGCGVVKVSDKQRMGIGPDRPITVH